ncbi:SagB family peptide dehydrogenase [Nocardia rhamnosiphila]|uniref:SagB family peptide dehydrogenase n=1 Tax=Nocardia rhamnosiphila TaxID=426716 RepID=UPI0033E9F478
MSSPDIDTLQVRFVDNVLVAADDEHILIANRNTGAYSYWPRSDEERLSRYMTWQSIPHLIAESLDHSGKEDRLNAEVETLEILMKLGVLDERTSDLSGARLSGPGPGWATAMRFLLETRTSRKTIYASPFEFNEALAEKSLHVRQPSAYYERTGTTVHPLSTPTVGGKNRKAAGFEEVLQKRRTARRFADAPITEAQLSTILYYGWGSTFNIENPLGDVFLRKTSPSGGSLHPIEVYPVVLNVDGIAEGLYHYSVRRHALEEIKLGSPREWIVEACGDQAWVAEAGAVFLCTAFLPRTAWKYDYSRVARAVMSEIGYTGQSALLTATWLGLGTFTTIALRDEIWEEKLELNAVREPVLSIVGVGQLESNLTDHSRPRIETEPSVDAT